MIAQALHWLGYGLCHQLPERSFFGGGLQLPVCARDTGIYLGFVLSLLVMALIDRGRRRSDLPGWPVMVLGGAMVAIMAWDGITSYAGLRSTTNDIRLVTGLLTAYYPAVTQLFDTAPLVDGAVEVDAARCGACGACIAACPYGAVARDPATGKALVDPVHCHGCGTCAAACPTGAASARHYTRAQIAAEISALLSAPGGDADRAG